MSRPSSRNSSAGSERGQSDFVSIQTASTAAPSSLPPIDGVSCERYSSGLSIGLGSSPDTSGFGFDALQQRRVRTLRFPFSKNMVSAKEASVLLENLKDVLRALDIEFAPERLTHGLKCGCGSIRFDAEIVKIPRLNKMHGVHFRRVKGDALEYKELCTTVITQMNL